MTKYKQNLLNPITNIEETFCYLSNTNKIFLELQVAVIKKLKITCTENDIQIWYPVIA